MTRLRGSWARRPETAAVFDALEARGHPAWFVGGCVRNDLAGQPVTDIDLATPAPPEAVISAAEAAGLRAVPTGVEHGTVTVVSDGVPHEITAFRRDEDTDGRHARVAFGTDMAEDAARRDFTMNALYADRAGTVLDPLGTGLSDLAAGRVRFIGDARARIAEDFLRILRFFRFSAWYGGDGGLDPEGLAACAEMAEGLGRLSRERVGAEMKKLLAAPDPAPAVAAMAASGILGRVLPGADARPLAVLVAAEAAAGAMPDPIRRLAALGGEDVAKRLRLSRAEARRLAALREDTGSPAGLAELAWRRGADHARDVTLLRAAAGLAVPDRGAAEAEIARGAAARFPLKAEDFRPQLEGPALGAALREAEARWIASDFSLGREELLAR